MPVALMARCAVLLLGLTLVAGCGQSKPAFHLNMVEMTKQSIAKDNQQIIANILDASFGTPDEPAPLPETGLDVKKLKMAAGPVWSDQHGKEVGLYRQHCVHCHGIDGDGKGPTAGILNPYPRDYRWGKYKFKSTELAARPTDADLERVIRQGVNGTAMPSFDLLPSDQVAALVEYVKYLDIRGETELGLIRYVSDELGANEKLPTTREIIIDEVLDKVVANWKQAPEKIIEPASMPAQDKLDDPAAIAAGRELFFGKANCNKCHGNTELGDGQISYDDWTKVYIDEKTGAVLPDLKRFVLKPQKLPPRNLRLGIYRGGRRPLDIYRKLHTGINGVGMPGFFGPLQTDDLWNVVAYVRSLPYEPISSPHPPQALPERTRL